MKRLLIIIVILMQAACAARTTTPIGQIPPPVIPDGDKKLEANAFVEGFVHESGYTYLNKGAEIKRVERIIGRLTQAAGYAPGTFPLHVVDAGEDANAMAVNGASIVVYKALLDRVPRDDELSVVLGHEIGHILAKHAEDTGEKERADAVSVGSAILGAAATIAVSAAGYGGVADLAGDVTETTTGVVGYGAFVGSYSRDQEYEADQIGLMIMAKAGYDPHLAPVFWSRAEEVFGASSDQVTAFFSTHPASSDRMDALNEAMPYAEQYYATSRKWSEPAPAVKKNSSKKK